MRRDRAQATALWAALLAGLVELACGAVPDGRLAVQQRFVDPALRAGASVAPPTLVTEDAASFPTQTSAIARTPHATIGRDTRPVLASHTQKFLAYLAPATPSETGHLSMPLAAGGRFGVGETLVLVAHVRPGTRDWEQLAPVASRVAEAEGGPTVLLDVAGPRLRSGEALLVTVEAYRVPETRVTSYETPAIEIPPDARLEIALGVLEPASREGAVRFAVDACENGRCAPLFDEALDPARGAAGWADRAVSLAALAGTTRSFRFRTEHTGKGSFTLPVWADPRVLAPAARAGRRPNVVLLSIDTLRRDHLDVYGYGRETAPYLRTQLAASGMVFDSLVAEAATTDASHMTMFTSLPAAVHGVAGLHLALQVPVTTLAEALRGHGYRTAAFTEDGPLAQDRGFRIGFDEYTENASREFLRPVGQVSRTFGQARAWLERNGDRPFFLFLHTFQVHAPYAPPPSHQKLFDASDALGSALPPEQASRVALYDGEIRYVDDELAALHTWSGQRGLNANTLWVVLSDHGEELWEHGSLGHATLPYEQVLQVPLVVTGPGVPRGSRSAAPLCHLDLMPTILAWVEAPLPGGLWGESFAELLRGNGGGARERPRPLFSTTWALPRDLVPPAHAVRLGDRKLLRASGPGGERLEYYDLASDPGEQRNLVRERAGETAELRALLDARAAALAEERLERAGSPTPPAPSVPLDPEREEKLRALGYIE